MWFKHITPTWYYIDPSQNYTDSDDWVEEDHDGSSIEKAARELPAVLNDTTVYLIRRTYHQWYITEGSNYPRTYCYNKAAGSAVTSGAMRVAIVGMPKQEDELYAYMPEEAKTAWGADSYDYATLAQNPNQLITNKHYIDLSARDVVLYNLLMRTYRHNNSSDDAYNALRNCNYGLVGATCENFEASKLYTCMNNCNFLDETERSGEIFSNMNPYGRGTPRFLSINYSNTCHIWNCDLLNTSDGWETGYYIYLWTRTGNCSVHDINMYNIPIGTKNDYSIVHNGFVYFGYPSNFQSLSKVEVHDIHMYVYRNTVQPSKNTLRPVFNGQANLWNVSNITIEMAEQQFGSYMTNPTGYMVDIGAFNPGSIVDGITATLKDCKGINFFNFDVPHNDNEEWNKYYTPKSQWFIVKNISFLGTPESEESGDTSQWGGNTTVVTITNSKMTYTSYSYLGNAPTCNQLIVQNINIDTYYNTSTSGFNVKGAMLDMVNNHLKCRVTARACTGKIGSIKTYSVSGAFTDDTAANLLYIGSITCNRNNPDEPYTGQQAIEPSWKSQILVGSTNTKFIRDNNFSNDSISNNNDHMYLCTSDTLEGNFVARNRPAKAETWSVYRTGGHSCTLRFVCEVADIVNYPLRIGDLPFAGIKRHLQKGINKCTFYMTTFGYNDSTQIKDKMRFRAKLPSGLYVGSNGEWSEDNETVWNNIELNTSYKYTFYIDMEEEGDVEFSYQFWWYMLGGYTYLDPFPAVELVQ